MEKVILPAWWTEQQTEVIGYTDALTTYCCSAEPCYYVEVPEFNYEGYFKVSDLKVQS